jgi:hypothetical protein
MKDLPLGRLVILIGSTGPLAGEGHRQVVALSSELPGHGGQRRRLSRLARRVHHEELATVDQPSGFRQPGLRRQ